MVLRAKWINLFALNVKNCRARLLTTAGTVRDFSNNHYFVFIVNVNKRTSLTMPFGYGKLKTKRNKKTITPQRKREVKNMTKQSVQTLKR